MANIKCSVVSCSYNKESQCYAERVNIGGKGADEINDTCCGTFLNSDLYSNLAQFTSMRGKPDMITCSANTCTYNKSGVCSLDSINVGGQTHANIYTETNCLSFKQE